MCVPVLVKKSDFQIITSIMRQIGSSYCLPLRLLTYNLKQGLEIFFRLFTQFSQVSLCL